MLLYWGFEPFYVLYKIDLLSFGLGHSCKHGWDGVVGKAQITQLKTFQALGAARGTDLPSLTDI